jgi:hypothetical protein
MPQAAEQKKAANEQQPRCMAEVFSAAQKEKKRGNTINSSHSLTFTVTKFSTLNPS